MSAEQHRTVVKAGVYADLDDMKRTYDGMEDLLSNISKAISATIPPEHSLDLNVIFFPQIGFLITMPAVLRDREGAYAGGKGGEEPWDLIFSTAVRHYYKDSRMRELDAEIGDIYASICGTLGSAYIGVSPLIVTQTERLRSSMVSDKTYFNMKTFLIVFRTSAARSIRM